LQADAHRRHARAPPDLTQAFPRFLHFSEIATAPHGHITEGHGEFLPNPHPGEILLKKFLKPMSLSQNRVAREIRVPPRRSREKSTAYPLDCFASFAMTSTCPSLRKGKKTQASRH